MRTIELCCFNSQATARAGVHIAGYHDNFNGSKSLCIAGKRRSIFYKLDGNVLGFPGSLGIHEIHKKRFI